MEDGLQGNNSLPFPTHWSWIHYGVIVTCLITSVIKVLLIIGGIELNPGPPKMNIISDRSEDENELLHPVSFTEPSDGVFEFQSQCTITDSKAQANPKSNRKRRIYGNRKRAKIFPGNRKAKVSVSSPLSSQSIEIPENEVSPTEGFEEFELLAKIPRIEREIEIEMEPLLDTSTIQFAPTVETTAQSKITLIEKRTLKYEETCVFDVSKSKEEMLNLTRSKGADVFDVNILECSIEKVAICKNCRKGHLSLYNSSFSNGLIKRYFIVCDICHSSTNFYNLPKISNPPDSSHKTQFGHNLLQVLGGRLVGIGRNGLNTINSIIGLPLTLSNKHFYILQGYLEKVSAEVARRSCSRAAQELREKHNTPDSEFLEVTVSYDGTYQKRSTNTSGGFSRYCFASAISVETGKVLSYEVACNSCRLCVEKQQALREKRIDTVAYKSWLENHSKSCQASGYGKYSSAALESQLAPVIFKKSIEDKLIYSTIVADGDDKSSNLLVEKGVYQEFGVQITRQECLSHVQKRIRIHLAEKQKEFIATNKTLMQAELVRSKSDPEKKEIRDKYRPVTLRDLKGSRDKWGDEEIKSCENNKIHLLPNSLIDRITSLYGLVIKSHEDSDLNALRDSLIAIVNHLSADDTNCEEMHVNCQPGEKSFCQYQRALARGIPCPKHPKGLSSECRERVLNILKPYFEVDFLEKVQDGRTSNLNENLHGLIWNHVSKTTAVELGLMQLGCNLAVIRFNDGLVGIREIVEEVGLENFETFDNYIAIFDRNRVKKSIKCRDQIKRRWSIKQAKRSRKRVGDGYQSGAYTQANVTTEGSEKCSICGGSADSESLSDRGVLGDGDNWLQCSVCVCWYHVLCLELNNVNINVGEEEDEIWLCPQCDRN